MKVALNEVNRQMLEEERKLLKQISNEPMSLRQFGRAIKLDALIRANQRMR